MALGNGTDVPGVNQLLLPWLEAHKGKRFGVISEFSLLFYHPAPLGLGSTGVFFAVLDFYDAVPGLVEAVIGDKFD